MRRTLLSRIGALPWRWVHFSSLFVLALPGFFSADPVLAAPPDRPTLRVTLDDNYPPFIFRDAHGVLSGYLVDSWRLWEQKNGTKVELKAMDWGLALRAIQNGDADVIDTIFKTEERKQVFAFSAPYASIPVGIYVDTQIGGITNLETLRGFVVGVKKGDACGQQLEKAGIAIRDEFKSYQELVNGAVNRTIRIVCLDEPPANFLLYRAGADKQFRRAFSLDTGQFHRAYRKQDGLTRARVEKSFAAITPAEDKRLRDKWFGPPPARDFSRQFMQAAPIVLAAATFLIAWNFSLRRRVRQRTAELNMERLRLVTLFQTLPDLVWLKDPDGFYLACNTQFERFFGATEANIIGKTDFDFVPAELASFFRQKDREALAADGPRVNEEWVTFANDGHTGLLETIKTPMRDAGGKLIGVLGIAREITALRKAEKALQAVTENLATAFRASPVSAMIASDRNDRLIDVNEQFLLDFGWPRDILLSGQAAHTLWASVSDYQDIREALHRQHTVRDHEALWKDAAGEERRVSLSATLIETQGEVCILAYAIDVTDKRQAEAILEGQRQVLELIATGASLDGTFDALIHMIEARTPTTRAAILLVSGNGTQLRYAAAPSLPRAFVDAHPALPIAPEAEPCGAAAFRRAPVICDDIEAAQHLTLIREDALAHGLRACWASPILNQDGGVLGVIGLFFEHPGRPSVHETRLISVAAQTASIAIVRQREDAALRASETYNKLLFADSLLPLLIFDPESMLFIDGNEAAIKVYGLPDRAALLASTPTSLSPEFQYDGTPSHQLAREIVQKTLANGECNFEWRHQRPDGFQWDAEVRTLRFAVGDHALIQVTLRDISNRKANEDSLRLASKVLESTAEGIMITDSNANIVAVNPAFKTIFGYADEDIVGRNPRFLRSGQHDTEFFRAMWQALTTAGQWRGEIWNHNKDGEDIPAWVSISAAKDARGQITHYVAAFSDIMPLKRSQEALDFQAHHDGLTGLPNRALLRDRLSHAMRRAARNAQHLAVLFIDLDRFKNVNDTLGHSVGDALILAAATRMAEPLRTADTLARWGGDEFVLLLEENASRAGAETVARKLLAVFKQPLVVEGREIDMTASIGVSLFPDTGKDADALLKQADMAMYQAKSEGRNAFAFYEARLGSGAEERMKIENALRRATRRNELLLHYQPQIVLKTGALAGVEALVRWQHPEMGLVPPGRFIPVAEDIGVIEEIGEWVLGEACRQMAEWRDAGIAVPRVSVNLSVHQIERTDLPGLTKALLARWQLDPSMLELEVTESILMRQTDRVATVLEALRNMGVFLAVDDFGTGYSSLAYLKRLPIHRIKIDQSFVRDIGLDLNDEAIVRAITALGHTMSLSLIAEGVERENQVNFLREIGCEEVQGFYFGRPVPADTLTRQFQR